jgi:DNA-directed RNA polymerase subunit omega
MPVTDRSKLPNAFEFVSIAGARARQLLQGCTPRVEGPEKPAGLAQREVLAGEVVAERDDNHQQQQQQQQQQ